jgi:hypothetical protein
MDELKVEMFGLIYQHIDYYKVENFDQLSNEDVDILLNDLDDHVDIVERTT